jgi:hypothetical protein
MANMTIDHSAWFALGGVELYQFIMEEANKTYIWKGSQPLCGFLGI